MDIIKSIEHEQLKSTIPDLKVGNTVKVHARIKEGNKERIQVFEGIIIKVQGSGVNKSFTVRKISYGVGVEKTFLIHSPLVEKVELVRVGKARRAKLFFLRDRMGKAAKTREVVGARIEDKEVEVKSVATEEVPVQEEKAVETPVQEEVKEEVVTETVKEEVVEEAKTEATPVEEKEEVKVETTEDASVEKETEKVEEVKEEKTETTETK